MQMMYRGTFWNKGYIWVFYISHAQRSMTKYFVARYWSTKQVLIEFQWCSSCTTNFQRTAWSRFSRFIETLFRISWLTGRTAVVILCFSCSNLSPGTQYTWPSTNLHRKAQCSCSRWFAGEAVGLYFLILEFGNILSNWERKGCVLWERAPFWCRTEILGELLSFWPNGNVQHWMMLAFDCFIVK